MAFKPNYVQQLRRTSPTRGPSPCLVVKTSVPPSTTWLRDLALFCLYFYLHFRRKVSGGLTRNTMCSESPGAEMAGEMSTGMTRSTFLAKPLPRARPWSSSLVGLDNASAPRRPQRYPQRCWGTAQWEAFLSPHGTPRCTQK